MNVTFQTHKDDGVFEHCKAIRSKVFCEEQGFVNEFDTNDKSCNHLLMLVDDVPAGCLRCFEEDGAMIVGRVCILPEYRGLGLGRMLIESMEQNFPSSVYRLHSQLEKVTFYGRCGYEPETGLCEPDEGVMHCWMSKQGSAT